MSRKSIDTGVIEHFLTTSALYLGVNVPEQTVDNESPVTLLVPESSSIGWSGGRIPSQQGGIQHA